MTRLGYICNVMKSNIIIDLYYRITIKEKNNHDNII